MKLNLAEVWNNEAMLARAFSWLTKIGAGRKFGSLPIGWYQLHQCACLDILRPIVGANPVRCKFGKIQFQSAGKWVAVMSTAELFQQADNKARSHQTRGEAVSDEDMARENALLKNTQN